MTQDQSPPPTAASTPEPDAPIVTLGQSTPAGGSESTLTVLIAFTSNLLVAVAKTWAAALTGSASMVAEAAHSWADTGNEIFLMIANRLSRKPADRSHQLGYGREAYVWSLFAALGLFVAGSAVSITHGIHELITPEPATDFLIGYLVLGFSFLLEGTSFLQSVRQARREARELRRDLIEHVLATSDPTLRAVFAEDAAALTGLIIAATGLALHEITGSAIPDAIGSILVGVLLGVVAIVLINRNRQFLIGQEVAPQARSAALTALLALPEVERVTALRMKWLGASNSLPMRPAAPPLRLQQEDVVAVEVRADAAAVAGPADHQVVQPRVGNETEPLQRA